jgi:hypothetical protein
MGFCSMLMTTAHVEKGLHASRLMSVLPLQDQAIEAGLTDAKNTIKRAGSENVLRLFIRSDLAPLADPKLEALRAYAELSYVLQAEGRIVPSDSLIKTGFSASEIESIEEAVSLRLARSW